MVKTYETIPVIPTLALFAFIYIPVIIVNAYKYGLNRYHIVFQKRYAKVTIIVVVIIVIQLIFNCMSLIIQYLIPKPGNLSLIDTLIACINSLLEFSILYCWVWRFWLLSFECKLLVYMNKTKWQSIINDNYCTEIESNSNHWYLTHKRTYGNYSYFGKFIITPCIIISSLLKIGFIIIDTYNNNNRNDDNIMHIILLIVMLLNHIIPFIILIFIFKSIPKHWDNFYICSELRKICITLFIDNLCYITTAILASYYNKSNHVFLFNILQINTTSLSQFICIMIATHWVNKKVSNIIEHNKFELYNIEESKMPLIAVRSKTVTSLSSNPINQVSLIQILSNRKSFEIFIKHLIAEFCIECLLSLVEIIQFQQLIYYNYFLNNAYNNNHLLKGHRHMMMNDDIFFNDSLFRKINFPDTVPKSKIVYSQNGDSINIDSSINKTSSSTTSVSTTTNHQSPFHVGINGIGSTSKNFNISRSMIRGSNPNPMFLNESSVLREEEEEERVIIPDDERKNKEELYEIKYELRRKAKLLYNKYICVGSQYEINIAWTLRNKFIKLFDDKQKNKNNKFKKLNDYDLKDFIDLYECVSNDMYKLMKDSYDRFRKKNEYQKLKKLIFTQ